jgi:hypothetical protein
MSQPIKGGRCSHSIEGRVSAVRLVAELRDHFGAIRDCEEVGTNLALQSRQQGLLAAPIVTEITRLRDRRVKELLVVLCVLLFFSARDLTLQLVRRIALVVPRSKVGRVGKAPTQGRRF